MQIESKKIIAGIRSAYRLLLLIPTILPVFAQALTAQEHFDFTYPDRSSLLSAGWDFIAVTSSGIPRNTEQVTGAIVSYDQQIHPGVLRIPVDIGDFWEGINNTRNTIFHNIPAGWTSIKLKIAAFDPVSSNQQATLAVYQDDDNYVQISRTFEVFNRIMFTSEAGGSAVNLNSLEERASKDIFLRLDRDPAAELITSYYSLNDTDWTEVGNVVHALNKPRLAVEVGASPGGFPNADFEWAEVSSEPLPPVTDELRALPSSFVLSTNQNIQKTETRSVFIFSSLGKILGWKQSTDVPWLTADSQTGKTEGVLKVSVNTAGLKAGIYQGNITLESSQSTTGPVIIPVTLIVNPDTPVGVAVWKDSKDAAMSVSVDDAQPSGFDELNANGFKGTYVMNGSVPPPFYSTYLTSGMELGCHLVNHPCYPVSDEVLKSVEIEPNITNLSIYTPVPLNKIISLVWPCGFTNYREQAVASEFFLSARGYNINMLEDATPNNFMNLKSYNSHEHIPLPPTDLKTLVDSAILLHKWFNLVLHNLSNDDGAINYSHSRNIWVAPIGTVIKYILQRDRFILNSYTENSDRLSFNISRLPVPPSATRIFEDSFEPEDIITIQVDIDDNRLVASVLIDGMKTTFKTMNQNGNRILITNVKPDPNKFQTVEVNFRNQPVTPINLSSDSLRFNTIMNTNPPDQYLYLLTDLPDQVRWSAAVSGEGPSWRLRITPDAGILNDTLLISVNSRELPVGNYTKTIIITSPDDNFYPFDINVNLKVTPRILQQNYPNPFNTYTWIEYDLPESGFATMEILNSRGQSCEMLLNRYAESGSYRIRWDSRHFPPGIYFLIVRTRNFKDIIKMSLVK